MNSGLFLLSFLIATVLWQGIARVAGPHIGQWIYGLRVKKLKQSGFSFRNEVDANNWIENNIQSSMNLGLLLLAIFCDSLIGTFG